MKCFFCGEKAPGFRIRCDKCKDASWKADKYSIAKKLEMAERIKGIDKLEKQI